MIGISKGTKGRLRTLAGLVVLSVFVLGSFAGCVAESPAVAAARNGKLFAVSSEQTSFYRYGPQQGNGADESLPKDTLMTLIRPSFGYCKVQLVSGNKEGYVASEDIKPASPTLLAALNPPVRTDGSGSSGRRSQRENFDIRSTEPPPPETLPDPDLPPANPDGSPSS